MKNIRSITLFEVKRLFTSKLLFIYLIFYFFAYLISAIFFRLYGTEGSVLTNANAQSFPIQHLQSSLTFMAIFIAIYVGDITIQDRVNGTIKLTLLRSVSRLQYFASRVLCTFIFSIILTLIMLVMGYVVGIIFFGWGNSFEFYGVVSSNWQGIGLTILAGIAFAFAYFVFGLLTLIISLYLDRVSTLAIIAGASTLIGQYAVLMPNIKQYTIFQQLLFFHIDWFDKPFAHNLSNTIVLLVYIILTMIIGNSLFRKKDLYV